MRRMLPIKKSNFFLQKHTHLILRYTRNCMIKTIETKKKWCHPSKLMGKSIGLSLYKTIPIEKVGLWLKTLLQSWIMLNSESSMNGSFGWWAVSTQPPHGHFHSWGDLQIPYELPISLHPYCIIIIELIQSKSIGTLNSIHATILMAPNTLIPPRPIHNRDTPDRLHITMIE